MASRCYQIVPFRAFKRRRPFFLSEIQSFPSCATPDICTSSAIPIGRCDVVSANSTVAALQDMSGEAQNVAIEDTILQTGRIDDATDDLIALTSGRFSVFSKLISVRIGHRDWDESSIMAEWMTQEQGWLGAMLMRKLRPNRWCQFNSGGVYAHPSTRPVEYTRGDLPELFTAHPNIDEEFVILWSTTNHILITELVHSPSTRQELGRHGMIAWVVQNIQSSFPECLGTPSRIGSKLQTAIETNTRIVISGLRSSGGTNITVPTDPSSDYTQWQNDDLMECHQAMARPIEFWRRMISLEATDESQVCQNCGIGCDTRR